MSIAAHSECAYGRPAASYIYIFAADPSHVSQSRHVSRDKIHAIFNCDPYGFDARNVSDPTRRRRGRTRGTSRSRHYIVSVETTTQHTVWTHRGSRGAADTWTGERLSVVRQVCASVVSSRHTGRTDRKRVRTLWIIYLWCYSHRRRRCLLLFVRLKTFFRPPKRTRQSFLLVDGARLISQQLFTRAT